MKTFIATFLLTLLLAAAPPARATAQAPDWLVLDGERLMLETNPLRPLLDAGSIKIPRGDAMSSGNWRGYIATFELREDRLLLTHITVERLRKGTTHETDEIEVLPEVFKGKTEVAADWYSGALILPRGKLLNYVHMGYASTYERYTVLNVRNGRLVDRRDLDDKQYTALRKQRFAQYKKTPAYSKALAEMRRDTHGHRLDEDEFLYEFATEEYMSLGDPPKPAPRPRPPLPDGDHAFQHREAEHPAMPAEPVRVRIAGDRILVFNDKPARWMPRGLVTQGHLRWNAPNQAWIIAKTEADADAKEAGHCSDGPDIVDLEKRIWWTC